MTDVDPKIAGLAANLAVPDDLLLVLAETDDEDVQRPIVTRATARRLPAATVEVLSRSPHEGVRATLVGRIEVPDDILIRLARDPSLLVRQSVAARFEEPWQPVEHYAPVEAYEALAEDDDDTIRAELLANPEVPPDIVRRLTRDDEDHRWTSFHSGRLTDEQKARLARHPHPKLAAAVDPPPPPTEAQLRERLADPDPRVRRSAAKDPALPVGLMWELATAAGLRS